jgi:4-diphosphocytidyl-2-C-methyl-D-erythritol kinase
VITFPNSKINLGLHILRKRPDGFHDLETIFYPISLQDALEIVSAPEGSGIIFSQSGLLIDTHTQDNICVKAWNLLKKDYPELPSVKMHLHKCIPTGAGLGGGSADGAFALMALNKKFHLEISPGKLLEYALQLGSDCPFFIKNEPVYATGRGEKMEPVHIDLGAFKIIVVNPGIHVSTATAFSHVIPRENRLPITDIVTIPVEQWRHHLHNDFQEPVSQIHHEIRSIIDRLYADGAVYASMTGSGSTVYGIFRKEAIPEFNFPAGYYIKVV